MEVRKLAQEAAKVGLIINEEKKKYIVLGNTQQRDNNNLQIKVNNNTMHIEKVKNLI